MVYPNLILLYHPFALGCIVNSMINTRYYHVLPTHFTLQPFHPSWNICFDKHFANINISKNSSSQWYFQVIFLCLPYQECCFSADNFIPSAKWTKLINKRDRRVSIKQSRSTSLRQFVKLRKFMGCVKTRTSVENYGFPHLYIHMGSLNISPATTVMQYTHETYAICFLILVDINHSWMCAYHVWYIPF